MDIIVDMLVVSSYKSFSTYERLWRWDIEDI